MSGYSRLAVSVLLLGAIVWYLGGVSAIAAPFREVEIGFIVAAWLVMTVDRLTMTFKWTFLLRSRGQLLSLLKGMKIICSAMISGMFLPSTIGADAIRVALTSRAGLDLKLVTASVVIERMTGFLCSLILGLVGLLILRQLQLIDNRYDAVFAAGAALLTGSAAVFGISFTSRWYERLRGLLPESIRLSKAVRKVSALHRSYTEYGTSKTDLATFFGLSFAQQFFPITITWLLALGFGVDVDLFFMIGVIPLTLLMSRLPISLDGIGVYEGTLAGLMALGGTSPAVAVGIALMYRVVTVITLAPWAVANILESGRPPRPGVGTAGDSAEKAG